MRPLRGLGLAWLLACGEEDPSAPVSALDLTEPLGPDEARAGVVTDPAALWGGVSAEGQVGDVKIYNDRVRFVIQSARPSGFYVELGGGVIDADVVRQEGEPGRDVLDEWMPMAGLGHLIEPTAVEVLEDGQDGGAAVVRVRGREAPLRLLEGALEAPGMIVPLGVEMTHTYRLDPGSWLLEVETELVASAPLTVAVGDLMIGAPEVSRVFTDQAGFGADDGLPRRWSGYVSDDRDLAVALVAPAEAELTVGAVELLRAVTDLVVGYGPSRTLEAGQSARWTRWYGVGPDLATVTDAARQARGEETTSVSGVVRAPDGPVAGASVALFEDDRPVSLARTDAEGAFQLLARAGASTRLLAEGRGTGLHLDLPAGAVPYGPYGEATAREALLQSLQQTEGQRPAAGRGVALPEDPLTLGEPSLMRVRVADGAPFAARLARLDPPPLVDPAVAPDRAEGLEAAGWSRGGSLDLPCAPGRYLLTVFRGLRHELVEQEVELAAGQTLEAELDLARVVDTPGWLIGDPHSHASPSGDGDTSMSQRLIGHAAVDIQVHFGTDHDHLADYRPLVQALGLSPFLRTVVGDEVSPPLRGHFNIWPVEPLPGRSGGAWSWWEEIPESTEWMIDRLRQLHGEGFVVQINHPTESGMATVGQYSPGRVGEPNRWTDRFQAMEVLNSGQYQEFLEVWIDLVQRGYVITPVGVSDAHGAFSGRPGRSVTWFKVDTDDPSSLTDARLEAAARDGAVVVSRGPFLDGDLVPGSTVVGGTTWSVRALAPSWVQVDRLILHENGVERERVEGSEATFELRPEADAWYFVEAQGDQPMAPLDGDTPWAMTNAVRVDVNGDGWTPPAGPLTRG